MIRLRWRAGILAGIGTANLLAAFWCCARAAESQTATGPSAYAIRWIHGATNQWAVEVSGVDAATLRKLQNTNWPVAQWRKLLAVHAERGDLFAEVGAPPMSGSYEVVKEMVRFTPQFPPEPGLQYRASFHPENLPGGRSAVRLVTAAFRIPARPSAPSTVVRQVYPSASVLPENLLKFYVHFSAPMSRGHIYDHIHLRNAEGKDVELPFLEIDEELWDPMMTRLTLFIDPGRIKRGVTPLEEVGPALEQGKRYTLAIDREWTDASGARLLENFRKSFEVGPPDREPIDPATWRTQAPRAETRDALTVAFPKPLDHALAMRMIQVLDDASRPVEGTSALEDQERRWTFTPKNLWSRGAHTLLVQTTIEDLSGNNIGKAFEVDLFEKVQKHFTNAATRLPFAVR